MSHELEMFDNGRTAFVAGGNQDPWHRLGTVLPGGLTAEQVMVEGHLGGWSVRKQPIYTSLLNADGVTQTEVAGKYVMVRTHPVTGAEEIIGKDEAPGVVGESYTPYQNESLTEYLQTLTDESGAMFDTAGSMRGGADVFVTMKMPNGMLIGGVDRVDLNIAILNNHTGNRAITGLITPTRIVCANTQAAALGNAKASFKIRHTVNAGDRVEEARQALGLTWAYMAEFEAEAERMIQEAMTIDAFKKVCDEIWKPVADETTGRSKTIADNRKGELNKLFLYADTNKEIRYTRWAAYQTVTEYLDHVAPVNGKTTAAKAINRAVRSIDGNVVETKQRAFALLKV